MKIAMASDHAGYLEKKAIKEMLTAAGHEVTDLGTDGSKSVDYPDFALAACKSVVAGQSERAILICGTGIGMSIAANKVKGIRAAAVTDEFSARRARAHNDANVLCLGETALGEGLALSITDVFLNTPFEGGRHSVRIGKIAEYESKKAGKQ